MKIEQEIYAKDTKNSPLIFLLFYYNSRKLTLWKTYWGHLKENNKSLYLKGKLNLIKHSPVLISWLVYLFEK